MTNVIPVKRWNESGIGEFQDGDKIPAQYVGGLTAKNLLINADMQINQRLFVGGSLAEGVYGYDRWKAGAGGCDLSVNESGLITHVSGTLVQIIESPPGVYGGKITLSVESPSGTVNVTVGGASAAITSGEGRRGVTLDIPEGSGNLMVQLEASNVTYSLPQLERGTTSTDFDYKNKVQELSICKRYYEKSFDEDVAPVENSGVFRGAATYIICVPGSVVGGNVVYFQTSKRVSPVMKFFNPVSNNSNWRNRNRGTDGAIARISYGESGINSFIVDNNTQDTNDALGQIYYVHWTAEAEI